MRSGGWSSIVLIYCYGLLAVASTGKVPPVIGQLATDFDVPRGNIGWVISAAILAAALGGGACGAMIDQIGRRRALAGSCIVIFLSSLVAVLCPTYKDFLMVRFIEGIGYLGIIVVAPVMLIQTTVGIRQVKALILWSTLFPVGYGFGLLLGALANGLEGGWRLSFELHASLAAVLAISTPLLPRSEGATQLGGHWSRVLGALRESRPVRVALAQAAYAFGTVGAGTVLPLYLSVTHKISMAHISSIIATASLICSAFGSLCAGFLLIRGLSLRAVIVLGVLLYTVSAFLMFMPRVPLESVAIVVFLWHLAAGVTVTVMMTVLPMVISRPEGLGGANGLLYQAGALGSLAGPILFFKALATNSWISLASLGAVAGLCILIAPVWRVASVSGQLPLHGLARTIAPKP